MVASTHATVPSVPLVDGVSDAARRALDTDPRETIARWINSLSPSAQRNYQRALFAFAEWLLPPPEATPDRALQRLVAEGAVGARLLILGWREHLESRHTSTAQPRLSSGSVAGYVTAIVSLLKACRLAGLINWTVTDVAPKVECEADRSGPRLSDVEQLIAHVDHLACTATGKAGIRAARDAAVIRLLYVAAMRRSEVTGLLLEHVQLEHADGPLLLVKRKGSRVRQPLLVSEGCSRALRRWIERRGAQPGPLFTRVDRGADGATGPLTGDAVRRMLRQRAAEAGIRATIRPHGLRHSAATHVASRASLATLLAAGGWRSLSAAQRYIDKQQTERRRALALLEV